MAWTIAVGLLAATLLATAAGGSGRRTTHGAGSASGLPPVLATGVAPVSGGTVSVAVAPGLQKVGDSARVVPLANAPIDASGNFTLRVDPSTGAMAAAVAHAVAANDGWLNMDLIETGANGETTIQSISRHFVGGAGQPISGASKRTGTGTPRSGHWAGTDGTTKVAPTYSKIAPASPARAAALHSAHADTTVFCYQTTTLASQANQDTVIGELHTANDTSAYFEYGKTADTDADVGIEIGGSGTWSISGSYHTGTYNGSFARWNVGDQFGYKLRSGFLYDDYHYVWNDPICGSNYFEAEQVEWSQSPDITVNPPNPDDYNHNLDNNCINSSYPSSAGINSSWGRSTNNFMHFGGAFNVFGFSGGAQSGASTYVQIHYAFGSATTHHYLCGNDNYISSAHRVFAGFG